MADVVYISGHGMNGDIEGSHPREKWFFSINAAANDGKVFDGPKWLIVSACNSMVDDVLESWRRLISSADDKVASTLRGALGLRGSFPDANDSVRIVEGLVHYLKSGNGMVEAWRRCLESVKDKQNQPKFRDNWVAVCNSNAIGDRLDRFPTEPPKGGHVVVCDASHPEGRRVEIKPAVFEAYWLRDQRVTASNRFNPSYQLEKGALVSVVVFAEKKRFFNAGDLIFVTIGSVRWNYPDPIDVTLMFELTGVVGGDVTAVRRGVLQLITGPYDPSRTSTQQSQAGPDTYRVEVVEQTDRMRLDLRVRQRAGVQPRTQLIFRYQVRTRGFLSDWTWDRREVVIGPP